MAKKVLITGGAGFIGSHLAERLLNDGQTVIVIDDLSTGSAENIEHLLDKQSFEFHEDTIFNRSVIEQLISDCDVVYHLAASVGVRYIIENPLKSLKTNVQGTEIILDLCSKYKRKTVLASTSEIYGKNEKQPLAEDDDRVLGSTHIYRWSYSCSKAMDEFLALAYHKEESLPIIIVRFFNICGPRQTGRYGMVVPRFVQSALKNEPITVYGDGQQVRSFTYIDDAIEALGLLEDNEQALGQVFNVGSRESVSIFDLAQKVKDLTASTSEIKIIPYEQAYDTGFEDMRFRVPDITKISDLTGYQPKINLEQMLKSIIDYHGQAAEK